VSNALDYQARRGNVRFKDKENGKNEFVHTLNASGLATAVYFPAILEQFQTLTAALVSPKPCRSNTGFKKIEPKK
jgi:seryl-tRNA synthetase